MNNPGYVPKDLPAKSTLYGYFDLWTCHGVIDRIHHMLYLQCRDKMEREASPTACIIDSQSLKSAEKGGDLYRSQWLRCGKKIKGNILVDTQGLLMHAIVHPADIQDRDGGVLLIAPLFGLCPFLRKLFDDGGYQKPVFEQERQNI